jgi:hypothetical protein
MRVRPEEYTQLQLRAHALLADVPLHDVWAVDLPGEAAGRSVLDLRALLAERRAAANRAVRFLFALRSRLGKLFGWDNEPASAAAESYLGRLSAAERAASLVAPGTLEGPFRVLFVSQHEWISEVRNATVHAFSVFALVERSPGLRLFWGIYVRPVGRITRWYMRLFDPFRRLLIYPAVLSSIRAAWSRSTPAA